MFYAPNAQIRSSGMRRVINSAVVDCSASCGNSFDYPYSLVWRNLVIDPAIPITTDPESSGPIFLGAFLEPTASDPTFVGVSGRTGAYFTVDGLQYFTYSGFTYTTPPVMSCYANNWHKTTGGQDFAFLMNFRYQSNASVQTVFTTRATGANIGCVLFINTNGTLAFSQRGNTAAVTSTTVAALVDNTDYIIGCSYNHAANRLRIWTSATAEQFTLAFNATTSNATTPLFFGVSFDSTLTTGSFPFEAGSRFYDITLFNAEISNAQYVLAAAEYAARR